jgi:alpha-tubulin suppressor-like RCC1 family protein
MAWGSNDEGQLGNGSEEESYLPVVVSGLSGVKAMSGGEQHSLALLEDGDVMAWGGNEYGQLGDGTLESSFVPVLVSRLSGYEATAIAAGGSHSMVLARPKAAKWVYTWGNNEFGALGNGNTRSRAEPVRAHVPRRQVTGIAAGEEFSLAVLNDGTVVGWGTNVFGELGDGTEVQSSVPVAVSGLSGVTAVAAGCCDSIALLSTGTIMAWGNNQYGQLGEGNEYLTESDVPVSVGGLSGVTAIAAGYAFNLALLGNGTVMAWGDNEFGALGDGTTESSAVPVQVSGLSGVTAIAAGGYGGLALLSDGTVMAWGDNEWGQLGDGNEGQTESDVPVTVSGLSDIKGIAAGEDQDLAFGPNPPAFTGATYEATVARHTHQARRTRPRPRLGLEKHDALLAP